MLHMVPACPKAAWMAHVGQHTQLGAAGKQPVSKQATFHPGSCSRTCTNTQMSLPTSRNTANSFHCCSSHFRASWVLFQCSCILIILPLLLLLMLLLLLVWLGLQNMHTALQQLQHRSTTTTSSRDMTLLQMIAATLMR
jgi:hypothetical protein